MSNFLNHVFSDHQSNSMKGIVKKAETGCPVPVDDFAGCTLYMINVLSLSIYYNYNFVMHCIVMQWLLCKHIVEL